MKTLKPNLNAVIICLLTIMLFNACKKDKPGTEVTGMADITGKWVFQYAYKNTQVYQEVYQFNADSTFSKTRLIADTVSGQTISYQYMAGGKFHLNADKLQLYNINGKYNDYYVPLNQLVLAITATSNITYTVAVKADKSSFHFVYPPCPINADCVGEYPYYKK